MTMEEGVRAHGQDAPWPVRRVPERMVKTALACLPPQRCGDKALSGSMEEAGGARR